MFSTNILSIDIGTYYTKLVVGKSRNDHIAIERADILHTPINALRDGQIMDVKKISDIILPWLHEKQVKVKKVIFTLDSFSIITREMLLPHASPKDFDEMFQYEVQQYFPTNLDDYIIQYKKIEEIKENDFKKLRILVAALPKMVIENYAALAKDLGLKPMALDIHYNALAKIFHQQAKINDGSIAMDTIALIDLGYANIHMNIFDKGIPQFNRLLPVGGKDMDGHIADAFNLSMKEAEEKKLQQGRLYDMDPMDPALAILGDMIRSTVDIWIDEIQRIFKFYTSRNAGNKIDKIFLFGGHGYLEGISKYIGNYFNIPTEIVDTIDHVKINPLAKGFKFEYHMNAMGALIRK